MRELVGHQGPGAAAAFWFQCIPVYRSNDLLVSQGAIECQECRTITQKYALLRLL